ncbi:MAG: FtsQ-type POTRA domain-containing protein [Acidobacteriota bacterium]
MSVAAPSDRRFRRAAQRPVRHRHARARALLRALPTMAVLGVMGYAGYHASVLALEAQWLAVRQVTIRGNQRLSSGDVAGLIDDLKGENILLTDLSRWRERLLASSWVADVSLRRRLPSTVEIEIVERQPVGMARLHSELYLVDITGAVIDQFGPRYADCNLPVVDGLLAAGRHGVAIDPLRSQLVARLLADVRTRPTLATRISQVDVSDPSDVHVILDGDPAVVRLGVEDFLNRLESYVQLQARLRQRVPDIDYVDLRFENRVYVGPRRATGEGRQER